MCYREANLIINKNVLILEIIAGNEQITPTFFVIQKKTSILLYPHFSQEESKKVVANDQEY